MPNGPFLTGDLLHTTGFPFQFIGHHFGAGGILGDGLRQISLERNARTVPVPGTSIEFDDIHGKPVFRDDRLAGQEIQGLLVGNSLHTGFHSVRAPASVEQILPMTLHVEIVRAHFGLHGGKATVGSRNPLDPFVRSESGALVHDLGNDSAQRRRQPAVVLAERL